MNGAPIPLVLALWSLGHIAADKGNRIDGAE
jgi:hypothetical protein